MGVFSGCGNGGRGGKHKVKGWGWLWEGGVRAEVWRGGGGGKGIVEGGGGRGGREGKGISTEKGRRGGCEGGERVAEKSGEEMGRRKGWDEKLIEIGVRGKGAGEQKTKHLAAVMPIRSGRHWKCPGIKTKSHQAPH